MKKYFYSHLVDFGPTVIELSKLEINDDERYHLLEIAHDSVHHTVLDVILSELSDEDKKHFLHLLLDEKHEEIWEHLNKRIENIEGKIIDAAHQLQGELHKDIHELKDES